MWQSLHWVLFTDGICVPSYCREGATHKLLKFNLLLAERIVKDTPVRDLGGLFQGAAELQGCSR